MAYTPFLQNNSPTGTRRALGPTPAPVGLAAGTVPAAGAQPAADPYAGWDLSPWSYSLGTRENPSGDFLSKNWAVPAFGGIEEAIGASGGGYQTGTRNIGNGVDAQALFDPQGNQLAQRTYDSHTSLQSDDYAKVAALAAAYYGGQYALGTGGAPVAAGATELGSLGTAVGGNALGTSLAGGMGEAGLLTGGAVGGAGLTSGAGLGGAAAATAATAATPSVLGGIGSAAARNPLAAATVVSALTGGGGGGNAPTLNAAAAAEAQGQASRDASLFDTYLNRPDQVTPQGTLRWTLKPGADPKNPQPGDWVQTTALNETGQQLYDADQQLQLGLSGAGQSALDRVNSTLNQPLDTSGLAQMGQVSDFNGAERQRIEDALLARLNPGFAQDEEAMRSRTLNTGFELGSEGSQREQFRLDQAKNDARLAAIAQAGGEAQRLSDISRSNATFQNQSRQQGLQEILAERALPLNELNAIRNGTQVQQPQFSPVSQSNTAAAPVMEALMAQLQGQQTNAANNQSGYNALLASLAQLGGSYFTGKP